MSFTFGAVITDKDIIDVALSQTYGHVWASVTIRDLNMVINNQIIAGIIPDPPPPPIQCLTFHNTWIDVARFIHPFKLPEITALSHRLRRLANNKPTLGQYLMFTRLHPTRRWFNGAWR